MKYECRACQAGCKLELNLPEDVEMREKRCIIAGKSRRHHPAKWIKIEDEKE